MACITTQLYLFATDNTINNSKLKPNTKMKVSVAEFLPNQTILFHRKDSVVGDLSLITGVLESQVDPV
jgi:hypothetical protein